MKKPIRTSLLFLLLTGSVFAQSKLKRQHIIDLCTNEEQTFLFNPKGKTTEEIIKQTDTKGRVVVNRTLYTYDKDKVTRVQRICNDTLISDETSEYMNGDLVHFRRMVKGKMDIDEAYTYKKGQLLSHITTTPAGVTVKEVTYNNTQRTSEAVTRKYAKVIEVVKESREGNMVTKEFLTPPFIRPTVTKVIVYDYDGNVIDERTLKNGKEVKRIICRFENNIPVSKKVFENGTVVFEGLYDEYGNPLKEQDFTKKTVIIYENKFNTQHNLREVKVIRNDKEECIKKIENEYY